jgi:hypothetical protein
MRSLYESYLRSHSIQAFADAAQTNLEPFGTVVFRGLRGLGFLWPLRLGLLFGYPGDVRFLLPRTGLLDGQG